MNFQKYVQLYVEVPTHMKQGKLLVDRVRVEHRLFRSSRKRQSGNMILHSNRFLGKCPFPMVTMLH